MTLLELEPGILTHSPRIMRRASSRWPFVAVAAVACLLTMMASGSSPMHAQLRLPIRVQAARTAMATLLTTAAIAGPVAAFEDTQVAWPRPAGPVVSAELPWQVREHHLPVAPEVAVTHKDRVPKRMRHADMAQPVDQFDQLAVEWEKDFGERFGGLEVRRIVEEVEVLESGPSVVAAPVQQFDLVSLFVRANRGLGAVTAMTIFSLGVYLTFLWVTVGNRVFQLPFVWQQKALDTEWAKTSGSSRTSRPKSSSSPSSPLRSPSTGNTRIWCAMRRVLGCCGRRTRETPTAAVSTASPPAMAGV